MIRTPALRAFGWQIALDRSQHRALVPIMDEGAAAFYECLREDANQYPEGTDERLAWQWGWMDAFEANR